jgi:hypothetical protein
MKVIDDTKCKQYASTFVEYTLNITLENRFSDLPKSLAQSNKLQKHLYYSSTVQGSQAVP